PQRYATKAPAYAPVQTYNWSGLYVGVNGGWGFGTSSHTDANFGLATAGFGVNGGLAGGTIGYNYQIGQWVLGLEGDLDWAHIAGSATPLGAVNYDSYLGWLSTVR